MYIWYGIGFEVIISKRCIDSTVLSVILIMVFTLVILRMR